jgi:hypothetical protein
LFYWFYASGEVQPWAKQSQEIPDNPPNYTDIENNPKSYAYSNEGIELKEE